MLETTSHNRYINTKIKIIGGGFMNGKYLKTLYSAMNLIYYAGSCTLGSFAVIYLQYKGLSNTMIGIVIGGAAFLSIFTQTYVAQLVENISSLTVKKAMQFIILLSIVFYGAINMMPLPKIIIASLYMTMCMLNYCMQTLLNAMAMEYIDNGYSLNFGFSRGIGSLSLALSAVTLGFVLEKFPTNILGYIYISLSFLLLILVSAMKKPEANIVKMKTRKNNTSGKSITLTIIGNKALLCILIGFCLANVNNGAVGTYMIDIVKGRGGTEYILGIANFIACISEVPIMMISGILVKRIDSGCLLKISAFFFWLKPVIILFSNSIPVLFLACTLQGLSYGIFFPTAVSYINQCMAPGTRVKGQAVFGVVTSGIAFGFGNMLGGLILDISGFKIMVLICTIISFIGFLIVLRIPGVSLYSRIHGKQPGK